METPGRAFRSRRSLFRLCVSRSRVFLMYSFHVQGSKLLPEGCGFPAHVSGSLTQLFRCRREFFAK